MAFNPVPVTPGSGAPMAADLVGTSYFQYVKLDMGALGATSPVSGALPVAIMTTPVPVSYKLGFTFSTSPTIAATALLIFACAADTSVVRLSITNAATTVLYIGRNSSMTITNFMFYLPPYQNMIFEHAGISGTGNDLYGIRAAGESGLCNVDGWKHV